MNWLILIIKNMKRLLIIMLKHRVRRAKKEQSRLIRGGATVVADAYGTLIKSYESSILFLNAESHN